MKTYELATFAIVFGLLTGTYWLGKDLTTEEEIALSDCKEIKIIVEPIGGVGNGVIEKRTCLDGEA